MVLLALPIDLTHQSAEVGIGVIFCQLFNGDGGVCCAGVLFLNDSSFQLT
uniref:Uncharacterized protein n=1 Tax=Anguilla anguilla TaxID=7936 RepID=A0A0E9XM55_ANGAN